jgi:hypothetical protein
MQFLYGLLTAVVIFVVLAVVYYVGYKRGKHTHTNNPTPIPDEDKKSMQEFNKHFKEMFAYDVDKAIQRKKVT